MFSVRQAAVRYPENNFAEERTYYNNFAKENLSGYSLTARENNFAEEGINYRNFAKESSSGNSLTARKNNFAEEQV